MEDTIVLTWHRKLANAQIEHLQSRVEQYGEDTQVVKGGGHGADAGWITSTVPVSASNRHKICNEVREYFLHLDTEKIKVSIRKANRKFPKHKFALAADKKIIVTFPSPMTGYQSGDDKAARIASAIPGAKIIEVARRERQAMMEYTGCTLQVGNP